MTKGQLLAKGQRRPLQCMCVYDGQRCKTTLFSHDKPVIYPWIVDRNGRVLWYFYSCARCYFRAPTWMQRLAIEPPRPPAGKIATVFSGDSPIAFAAPPRRRTGRVYRTEHSLVYRGRAHSERRS